MDIFLEFFKIGISGFIFTIGSIYFTAKHYKRQIRDNIYLGPLLTDVYNPLIQEFNRYTTQLNKKTNPVIDMKLINSILTNNQIIINATPPKNHKILKNLKNLTSSPVTASNFEAHSQRIYIELFNLKNNLESMYKEFGNS